MKKRTRVFLFAAASVLIASLATGLVAWATRVSAAAATDELAYVPATALMVAYADVRGLMNSPFHDRIRQLQRTSPAAGADDLEARTGIRFDTDIDGVLVASSGGDAPQERAARRFLDDHFDDIGVRSTVDLRAEAQAEWA